MISRHQLVVAGVLSAVLASAPQASASIFVSNTTIRVFPCSGQLDVFATANSSSTAVRYAIAYAPSGTPTLPSDTTYSHASVSVDNNGHLSVWNSSDALVVDINMYQAADSSATLFYDSGGLALQTRDAGTGNFGTIGASDPCSNADNPLGGSAHPCASTTCYAGGCGAGSCGVYNCPNGPGCFNSCGSGKYACCNCDTGCKCYDN